MNAEHPLDSGPYATRTHRNPRLVDIVESYQLGVPM
jgi:hypothetical protein